MTVEGEKDDITGTGQCRAALDLCSGIPADNKLHFECPKVGHYGVFNGSRFRSEIAPRMTKFMRAHDPCADRRPHDRRARAHGEDAAARQQERGYGKSRLQLSRELIERRRSRNARFSRSTSQCVVSL